MSKVKDATPTGALTVASIESDEPQLLAINIPDVGTLRFYGKRPDNLPCLWVLSTRKPIDYGRHTHYEEREIDSTVAHFILAAAGERASIAFRFETID